MITQKEAHEKLTRMIEDLVMGCVKRGLSLKETQKIVAARIAWDYSSLVKSSYKAHTNTEQSKKSIGYKTGIENKGKDMSLDFTLTDVVFDANITHNLGAMAKEAGIYNAIWHPEEIGVEYAEEIIEIIEKGLTAMKSNPERYKKYDDPDGWGLYENFVRWVEELLNALKENPNAKITVRR